MVILKAPITAEDYIQDFFFVFCRENKARQIDDKNWQNWQKFKLYFSWKIKLIFVYVYIWKKLTATIFAWSFNFFLLKHNEKKKKKKKKTEKKENVLGSHFNLHGLHFALSSDNKLTFFFILFFRVFIAPDKREWGRIAHNIFLITNEYQQFMFLLE